jgi:hypothetical protein
MKLHVQFYFLISLRGKKHLSKNQKLQQYQNKNFHSTLQWAIQFKKRLLALRLAEVEKDSISALWRIYIGERRTTFAKAYGIKEGFMESFREHH